MKDLTIIQVCPDDSYYFWTVHLWLESLREKGMSDKAVSLIFTPQDRKNVNTKWGELITLYPEATFKFYKDEHNIYPLQKTYIPILRPYCLWRYFSENPQLVNHAIFYYDCDVLLTEKFDISKLINDDVCYLSDTNSYINASYFDSKMKDVLPEKLEEYKKRDILGELAPLIGISREIAEKNNNNSGGAQYLLKGIDAAFWKKVMGDAMIIRRFLLNVNKTFFENESKGFQSWCADMWAVLWNLWWKGKETRVVSEMDFAWATDPIEKIHRLPMFHNAGIAGELQDGHLCFYKGKYVSGNSPIKDPNFEKLLNDEESKKWCTWWYASKLKSLSDKYHMNY